MDFSKDITCWLFEGKSDEIQRNFKEQTYAHPESVVASSFAALFFFFFFSIKSIFEVYNEGTRETILMQ